MCIFCFTLTSHECHGVSNHQQPDDLYNRFMLASKKTPKLRVTGQLWGESTGDRWIPITKGQLCGKRFDIMTSSCVDDIVSYTLSSLKYHAGKECFLGALIGGIAGVIIKRNLPVNRPKHHLHIYINWYYVAFVIFRPVSSLTWLANLLALSPAPSPPSVTPWRTEERWVSYGLLP